MKVLHRRKNDAVIDEDVIAEWDLIVDECDDVEELRTTLRSLDVVRDKVLTRIRKLS